MNLRTNRRLFSYTALKWLIFAVGTSCGHHETEPSFCNPFSFKGPVMSWAVSRRHLTTEAWVRSQTSPCEICGGQSVTGTGFSPSTSVSPVSTIPPMPHTHSFTYHRHYIMFLSQYFSFPCQYHSTNAPYPFIHLPPTLYNVSHPVLQFSPVSTIPPMLHTDLHLSPTLHLFKLNG